MTQQEKNLCKWFFNLVGYFNHYSFFTEKLWQQVPKFGGEDEANIKCAFMHYWFHNTFHYNTLSINSSWFEELDEKDYNEYIKEYEPVIEAYKKWIEEQR